MSSNDPWARVLASRDNPNDESAPPDFAGRVVWRWLRTAPPVVEVVDWWSVLGLRAAMATAAAAVAIVALNFGSLSDLNERLDQTQFDPTAPAMTDNLL